MNKDGFILNLLPAEMTARTGRDPSIFYQDLTKMFGCPIYERIDIAATPEQKEVLGKLSPSEITVLLAWRRRSLCINPHNLTLFQWASTATRFL